MKLQVWYVKNPPSDAQNFPVSSVLMAKIKIRELTERDLEDEDVGSNAMGLEVFEDGEWVEYYDNQGRDIMELIEGV